MATPHINAEKGNFADTVLMPGDPLRAKLIAETYLDDAILVNDVRGMFAYTGTYKGKRISIVPSGMGMPSMGIYSYELFTEFDVKNIIRIGSAGSYIKELNTGDVVLEEYAWSESTFAKVQNGYDKDMAYPSERLNAIIKEAAGRIGEETVTSPVHCTDVFYRNAEPDYYEKIHAEHGCGCVEMESFALFHNAMATGKDAACLLTISDSFVSHEEMDAMERQTSFHNMFRIAFEAAVAV